MSTLNKIDIKKIKSKTEGIVQGLCLVLKSEVITTGKNPYLNMTVGDGEYEINAKQWNYIGSAPVVGSVLDIDAQINVYNKTVSLIIESYDVSDEDKSIFEKSAPYEINSILAEMNSYINSINDKDLIRFIAEINTHYAREISEVPGATNMHHNYRSGWAMHTLEVMRGAITLAQLRNEINPNLLNMDLMLAGSYLHDIGKLEGYMMNDGVAEMTHAGKFLDHICLGLMLLERFKLKLFGDSSPWWYIPLCHIIASHHGKREWGSPVVPCIPEALVIHRADNESADMEIFHRELEEMSTDWQAKKSFKFDTRLYSGIYNKNKQTVE